MTDRSSEYRFDELRRDHVILAPMRAERPRAGRSIAAWDEAPPCPFCPGRESETPPEILALRPDRSDPDTPGWQVRVVPNRYPAVVVDGAPVRPDATRGSVIDQRLEGYGSHEVVVETPDHHEPLGVRSVDGFLLTLMVYRDRLRSLQADGRLAHVQIFKNVGRAAGATRQHPHSQIVATSHLPRAIANELDALDDYRRRTSRCLICDRVQYELTQARRIVVAGERHLSFCPYASRLPFEACIVPIAHRVDYADSSDEELLSLAGVLKRTVGALARTIEDLSMNLILHTAPPESPRTSRVDFHWRLELLPRTTCLAGFEWGTGMYINHLAPEEAAETLRNSQIPNPKSQSNRNAQ